MSKVGEGEILVNGSENSRATLGCLPDRLESLWLISSRPSRMFDRMKTMTTREFFHSPVIVKALRSGQSVVVTDNGKPSLIVTKAGKRPRRSRADLRRENREIFPHERPKGNLTQALKQFKSK
jgi:hypothetical protein